LCRREGERCKDLFFLRKRCREIKNKKQIKKAMFLKKKIELALLEYPYLFIIVRSAAT